MHCLLYGLIVLLLVLLPGTPAKAQVSIGIGFPSVSIGINVPVFPEFVRVPDYPIYYAPRVDANYFFYDGLYWVFHNDDWYASYWYNGPWGLVDPYSVPLFILRVPVHYYRYPPAYFRGWHQHEPPRWGQHWGHDWDRRRSGWDRWERRSVPAPAPLPDYQRRYTGNNYPRVEQQRTIRSRNYRYQPQEPVIREHFQQQERRKAPASLRQQQSAPVRISPGPQTTPQVAPPAAPALQGDQAEPRRQPRGQASPPQRTPAVRNQKQQPGADQPKLQPPGQASPQQRGPAMHDQKQRPKILPPTRQAPKPQDQQQGQEQQRQKLEQQGQRLNPQDQEQKAREASEEWRDPRQHQGRGQGQGQQGQRQGQERY